MDLFLDTEFQIGQTIKGDFKIFAITSPKIKVGIKAREIFESRSRLNGAINRMLSLVIKIRTGTRTVNSINPITNDFNVTS